MAFSASWELPPPSASPPEVLPLPPSSAPPSTATPRLRRRFLRFLPRERCRARGFQTGRRRVEEIYMGRVRGGGKRRRLVIDDSSPSPQPPAPPPQDEPPSPRAATPPAQDVDPLAAMLEEAMSAPMPPPPTPQVLRPYASQVPYSLVHPSRGSRGRLPLHRRPLCPQTLQGMSMADLIATMEHVGVLPPRPCCPICEIPFSLEHLRVRSRQEELRLPGGLTVHHAIELAMWCCPSHVELSIFTGAELLNPRWPLLQNE